MSQTPPAYRGLYINMDRSADRRAAMEAQLQREGLSAHYERFPGIDGSTLPPSQLLRPGEVGCLNSHLGALRRGAELSAHLHVLEDDAVLCHNFAPAALSLVQSPVLDQYDIVFTDNGIPPSIDTIRYYRQIYHRATQGGAHGMTEFALIDLKQRALGCASSYFISAKSVPKILARFDAEFATREPDVNIDMYYRRFCDDGSLRMACIVPFLTTIQLDMATTTTGRAGQVDNPTVQVAELLRYSFYVERDMEGVAFPRLNAIMGERTKDPHGAFLTQVLEFLISDKFKSF
ncbi:MAG: glycosyltransferase family 25 protein [Caulobacterales bacterium]